MKRILISGGHLTPALAVIDQATKDKYSFEFIFLGREFSQESSKQLSQEKVEVEKRGITFIPTLAPKFHKTYWWRNFFELTKWLPAFKTAWKTISEYKPEVFLTFGGYLAFPIAVVCRLRQIPVITHEQTVTTGLANRAISLFSQKVAVSHPESMQYFPKHKVVLTGNPIRPKLFEKPKKAPKWITPSADRPILYITGGNQGSEILNTVVEKTMSVLTSKWFVIHQCGNPNSLTDYENRLLKAAENLTKTQQQNYQVKRWIDEDELLWIFANARLVVARSGANTVQELIINELPAVLVPLPFSHMDEQQKNAEKLEQAGCAIILPQHRLTPETFLEEISNASRKHRSMAQNATELKNKVIMDGASRVLKLIEVVLKEKKYYIEQ